jgi:hypothetical protein
MMKLTATGHLAEMLTELLMLQTGLAGILTQAMLQELRFCECN